MTQPTNISELRSRAEAGDPRAQYMLAATLASSGVRDEADRWLHEAAKNGEADASYTLATRHLQTHKGAVQALSLLQGAAQRESNVAKRLLAVLYAEGLGVEADWRGAVMLVVDAARKGEIEAQREIAMLLLLANPDDADAMHLLENAANRDAIAAAVYARRSINSGLQDERTRSVIEQLGAMRYPNAAALYAAFNAASHLSAPRVENRKHAPIVWDGVLQKLTDNSPSAMPAAESLCVEPEAIVFRQAFSPEACEYIIAAAGRRLAPSQTVDPGTGASRRDAYRTSLTATLGPVDLDLALVAFNRRIARIAGNPHCNGEFLSVLHYSPGQEYKPHFDWLPPGEDFDRGGQRVTTALLYLNEDYEGGETHFLNPDIEFKGAPGDLLVFQNALADGSADKVSRHASRPVTSGVKWIASKWFRGKKYNF